MHAGLLRELALGAVFIKAGHRKETILRHAVRVVHRDQRVGVAGIADHKHAHIVGRVAGDGLALTGENFSVDAKKVTTLHPCLARHGADQERPVGAFESFIEIGSTHHIVEQGEGAVIELHHHSLKRGHAGLDFDEPQVHRLIRAKYEAGCDAKKERVADLTGRTGD